MDMNQIYIRIRKWLQLAIPTDSNCRKIATAHMHVHHTYVCHPDHRYTCNNQLHMNTCTRSLHYKNVATHVSRWRMRKARVSLLASGSRAITWRSCARAASSFSMSGGEVQGSDDNITYIITYIRTFIHTAHDTVYIIIYVRMDN